MLYIVFLLVSSEAHFNGALQFTIGDQTPEGAIRIFKDSDLDLELDCGGKRCPSVIIFAGQQSGTVNVQKCFVGQMYYFINKSANEYGIVVQHNGGLFGARAVNQYDMGTCFCYERGPDEIEKERRLLSEYGGESSDSDKKGGILLCR